MDDHNENINLDDISIEDIMKNNQFASNDNPEDDIDSTKFEKEHFSDESDFSYEPESLGTVIDHNDREIKKIEDWFQSEARKIEHLKVECQTIYRACNQKKQEIQAIKNNIAFSHDCKNDVEVIYASIENDMCENIKSHASDIGKNIRSNKSIAEMYLSKLKKDADLLTLQFDYTSTIEKFSITLAELTKCQKSVEEAKAKNLNIKAIKEERIAQTLHEQEIRRKIMGIQDIINQR